MKKKIDLNSPTKTTRFWEKKRRRRKKKEKQAALVPSNSSMSCQHHQTRQRNISTTNGQLGRFRKKARTNFWVVGLN